MIGRAPWQDVVAHVRTWRCRGGGIVARVRLECGHAVTRPADIRVPTRTRCHLCWVQSLDAPEVA